MDRYQNFAIDDFVWDEQFRNWVLRPTREDDARWQTWLLQNPDKQIIIGSASSLVKAISPNTVNLPAAEKQAAISDIISQLHQVENEKPERHTSSVFSLNWLKIAAAIILLSGLSWGLMRVRQKKLVDYNQLVESAGEKLIEKQNMTTQTLAITLPDGSIVKLNPGGKLSYPVNFGSEKREVYLSGEAFFDITKDASRPFFVYANEVVTKVLGTSFLVRSYTNETEVSVAVKTGRVAVFTRTDPALKEKLNTRELAGVVIEPNQQIVFVRESVKITKSLIPKPELVEEGSSNYNFDFDETPVSTVFSTLQKAYGIEIIYDKNLMNECPITATLTELSLYEKLDLVCKAVGARYELIDGRIIIEGKGCKL